MSNSQNMLREEVKQMCLDDADLLAKIANATGKKARTTMRMIERNQSKELRSVEVVKAIEGHTGLTSEEILTEKVHA